MAGMPPLRYIRKTTLVVIIVVLAFLVHRVVDMLTVKDDVQDVAEAELSLTQSVVCRHIVSGSPFGLDSVFGREFVFIFMRQFLT